MAPPRIADVVAVPVRGGFFADDQAAIRAGAEHDGFGYSGPPRTPGFTAVRQPGEALSVLLVLDDGSVEFGDCAAVQYSGAGGRDPVFSADVAAAEVTALVAPGLVGREVTGFRALAEELEDDGRLHTAIRYGVSQALLGAAARAARVTMAEVVRDEYATGAPLLPVPLYAQTGDDRYLNADKMVLKGVDVLPHGLFNSPAAFGPEGWGADRVPALAGRPDREAAPGRGLPPAAARGHLRHPRTGLRRRRRRGRGVPGRAGGDVRAVRAGRRAPDRRR